MFNCLTKPQKPDRHDGPRLRVPEHLDVQNFRLDVCVLAEDWWLRYQNPELEGALYGRLWKHWKPCYKSMLKYSDIASVVWKSMESCEPSVGFNFRLRWRLRATLQRCAWCAMPFQSLPKTSQTNHSGWWWQVKKESGWSWGLGFGFPKILSKCFSGSPSPYKHTYNLFLLSLYEQIYYVFLN